MSIRPIKTTLICFIFLTLSLSSACFLERVPFFLGRVRVFLTDFFFFGRKRSYFPFFIYQFPAQFFWNSLYLTVRLLSSNSGVNLDKWNELIHKNDMAMPTPRSYIILTWQTTHKNYTHWQEVRIYKRKQECKKTRKRKEKKNSTKKATK